MENSNFADHHRNQELDLHPFHLHCPIDPGLVPVPVRLLVTVRVMPPLLIAQHPQKGDPGRESTATLALRASTTLMIPANVVDVEKTASAPSAPNLNQNQNPDATAEGGTVRVRGKKRYLNWMLVSRGKKKKNLRKNGWKSLPR